MITLQPATPADIPLLQKLAHSIWHQVFTTIITPAQTDLMLRKMYDPDLLRQEMANGVVWQILRQAHTPIGYVSYSMTGPTECKLHKIYVEPIHHGKGLGKQLMDAALDYARAHHAKTLILRVNRANDKALRAYRAFGFREAESIDWEFAPGFILHDYKMERQITCL
jgi:GNAT superfamily N-acetyltransferase